MVRFVGCDRLRDQLFRVPCSEIRMPPLRFGLRAGAPQDEAATSLIEHLCRARPELLAVKIAIEADAKETRPVLGLLWKQSPRYLARLVEERVQEIPRASGLHLDLAIAVALDLSWNLRGVVPRVRPNDLRWHVQMQRLGLEQIAEVQRVVSVIFIFGALDLLFALGVH